MNILMVAPPGAGKGTQAKRLAAHYGLEHLASGDLLRHEMEIGSAIGKAAAKYVQSGDLVPDQLVLRLVLDRAFTAAREERVLLDGFPRNRDQAEEAYAMTGRHKDLAPRHGRPSRGRPRLSSGAACSPGRPPTVAPTTRPRSSTTAWRSTTAGWTRCSPSTATRAYLVSVDGERPVDEVTRLLIAALDGPAEAPPERGFQVPVNARSSAHEPAVPSAATIPSATTTNQGAPRTP